MTETNQIVFGGTVIPYRVHRSARRKKTVQIVLDPALGIVVGAPKTTPRERIAEIVRKRAPWIIKKAAAPMLRPNGKRFVSGESLLYLGRQVRMAVTLTNARRVEIHFRHWEFQVLAPAALGGDERRAGIVRAFIAWYRQRALERIESRLERWSGIAGYGPARVLIRDQRQRWGSCGKDGTLRFNWRIVMAPPALLDYVVVHELAHLRHRLHTPAFWAEVARLMPDYQVRRLKLKEIGAELTIG